MLDLRTASIKVKPSDSKEKDYHLALAEYLYKELKSNGIQVKKHNISLRVALNNKLEEKYEHIVIDCLEGKIYLRGKEVKDKYFGRLRRFQANGKPSDAYHCVAQSVTRIINRIKKLQDSLSQVEREVLADAPLDLRRKVEVARLDMRTKTASIQRTDMRTKVASVQRLDMRTKTASIQRTDMRKKPTTANVQKIDMRKRISAAMIDMRKKIIAQYTDLRKVAKLIRVDMRRTLTANIIDMRKII